MTCDIVAGHSEDRVGPPDTGVETAKEVANPYSAEGQTVQVVDNGDTADVYVVNEAGDATVAKITAVRGPSGWYLDSLEECQS